MNAFDCVALIIVALIAAGWGVLCIMADGMDPTGQKQPWGGCLTLLAGLGAAGWLTWLLIHKL